MSIYSFLIAVRSEGQQLMNESGETTSHFMGMFYRTLRIVDNGIKPLYVFDGAPPKLKSGELAKRFARKSEATEAHEEAKETGTAEEVEKFSRRTLRQPRPKPSVQYWHEQAKSTPQRRRTWTLFALIHQYYCVI